MTPTHAAGSRTLRFATYLAPSVRPAYEAIASSVGETIDLRTELHSGRGYERLVTGEEDVAFICGLPYVRLADADEPTCTLLAAPVLVGDRYRGDPVYFSDVIVRRDDPASCFDDLRGRCWAFNEPESHSGFGITRATLAERGFGNGFFGSVLETGFHQRSIELVALGRADASAIDSQVLEIAVADDPTLTEELRIVETWGPSTIQPVVAARRLDDGLKRDLVAALEAVALNERAAETLRACGIERLVPIDDRRYDDIRAMASAADEAGIEGLGTPPDPQGPA